MNQECIKCKRKFKMLGLTNKCFECDQEKWYKAYPSSYAGKKK